MGGSGEKCMLYNCAKKEETHHTSAYLEHTTHTQPGHITVRARGREGGQQARSRSAEMSRRRASGNGAARRQLEDGGSRASGSKTARGPRRRGPRRRERLRRRRRVQQLRAAAMLRVASAFAKTSNEQEELVVPPVAGAQGVGREHKLTPSDPSTALSLGRHHARRVSWPTRAMACSTGGHAVVAWRGTARGSRATAAPDRRAH